MGDVSALAALIDSTRARNDWTDVRVVQQAKDAGHNLSTSDISLWRKHGMRQLVPQKVTALAYGLRLPPYKVAIAVLADLGIEVPFDARYPEDAIAHDHTLSAQARETLRLIIDQDRREH